jgi:hypothetical protein
VLGNRGASGIDGLLSTALGSGRVRHGPTFALLGDLSFLYDAGACCGTRRRGVDIVVVVNDNAGRADLRGTGQRALPADELERLFVTPHGVDLERLCSAAVPDTREVGRSSELVPALDAARRPAASGRSRCRSTPIAIEPARGAARGGPRAISRVDSSLHLKDVRELGPSVAGGDSPAARLREHEATSMKFLMSRLKDGAPPLLSPPFARGRRDVLR